MNIVDHNSFINKKVFQGLDGLRFLSILAVVWHHAVGHIDAIKFINYGFLGVDLFFVISGFLIVSLLLRERALVGSISLKDFYIRRSLRIFPLYYGFIIGVTLLYFIANRDSEFGKDLIRDLPIYLLYLGNIFPVGIQIVWSLATEEQFYMVWPAIEVYLRKYIMHILAIALLVNQAINFFREEIFTFLGLPELANMSVFQTTFTPILLGVALAHMLNNKETFEKIKVLFSGKFHALIYLALLVIAITVFPEDISGFPRLVIQLILVLLVASVVTNDESIIQPFLNFSPIARIGAISYGIYLFHNMIITASRVLLEKVGIDNVFILFFVASALTILAAEISYRFYEKPFLKLKSKFSVIHQKHA